MNVDDTDEFKYMGLILRVKAHTLNDAAINEGLNNMTDAGWRLALDHN